MAASEPPLTMPMTRRRPGGALLLALLTVGGPARGDVAAQPAPAVASTALAPAPWPGLDRVPPRSPGAVTGGGFARATTWTTGRERQRRAVDELLRGNLPEFERRLVPVRLTATSPGGEPLERRCG